MTTEEPRCLVVLCHPQPDGFGHAVAHRAAYGMAAAGRRVDLADLYSEGFDPLVGEPLVAEHQRLVAAAETLVVAHPSRRGEPPTMLAGWMDTVVAPTALPRLRHLVVITTSESDPVREASGDPLEAVWARCLGERPPTARLTRRSFGPVGPSSSQTRSRWLEEVDTLLPAPAPA